MATKKGAGRKSAAKGAGEEIRKEMHAAKAGNLKNEKQAIAIGLSKARRAGKDVPPPKKGTSSPAVRKKALQDLAAGKARKTAASKKSATTKSTAKKATSKKAASKKSVQKKAAGKKTASKSATKR